MKSDLPLSMAATCSMEGAPRGVPRAELERFLRDVERRALCCAHLSCGSRDQALMIIREAMREFVRHGQNPSAADSPLLFWRSLHSAVCDATQDRLGGRPGSVAAAGAQSGVGASSPSFEQALRGLALPQRQAFLLRVWLGLDLARTADAMRSSVAAVKTHLFRALQSLRPTLQGSEPPEAGAGQRDAAWVLRARAQLEQSAAGLGSQALAGLDQARSDALAGGWQSARPRRAWLRWTGAMAVVMGLVLITWQALRTPSPSSVDPQPRVAAVDRVTRPPAAAGGETSSPVSHPDFVLLADPQDYDMLDDLLFYAWLDAQQSASD